MATIPLFCSNLSENKIAKKLNNQATNWVDTLSSLIYHKSNSSFFARGRLASGHCCIVDAGKKKWTEEQSVVKFLKYPLLTTDQKERMKCENLQLESIKLLRQQNIGRDNWIAMIRRKSCSRRKTNFQIFDVNYFGSFAKMSNPDS